MLGEAKPGHVLILVAIVLLAAAGCATRGDIIEVTGPSTSEIVSEVLAKDLPGVDPAGANLSIAGWKESVAQIEEFIARHPDDPQIVNALRIREAILLLCVGENNQGSAAFKEIDRTQLSNVRDKALFDVRQTLIWWYGIGGEDSGFSREDTEKHAKMALDKLAAVADMLNGSPSTKRLLEQMRVRIANRLASAMSEPTSIRAILQDALNRYAAQFAPSEYPLIQNWNRQEPRPELLPKLSDVRWYDYVPEAFKLAEAAWAVHVRNGALPLDIPDWVSCMEEGTCP